MRADGRRVVGRPRLDGDHERLPAAAGRPPHRDRVPGPDAFDTRCRALDVGRVDVAPAHDDDVLHPAADHHLAIDQVADVAGVQPAVRARVGRSPSTVRYRSVTAGPRMYSVPTERSVSTAPPTSRTSISMSSSGGPSRGNDRLGAPSAAGRARLRSSSSTASRSSTTNGRARRLDADPEGGLGHPVGRHRGGLRQAESPGGGQELAGRGDVDRLRSVQREGQTGQVEAFGPGQRASRHARRRNSVRPCGFRGTW